MDSKTKKKRKAEDDNVITQTIEETVIEGLLNGITKDPKYKRMMLKLCQPVHKKPWSVETLREALKAYYLNDCFNGKTHLYYVTIQRIISFVGQKAWNDEAQQMTELADLFNQQNKYKEINRLYGDTKNIYRKGPYLAKHIKQETKKELHEYKTWSALAEDLSNHNATCTREVEIEPLIELLTMEQLFHVINVEDERYDGGLCWNYINAFRCDESRIEEQLEKRKKDCWQTTFNCVIKD